MSYRLEEVNFDPFAGAQQQSAGVTLEPVDFDPFAPKQEPPAPEEDNLLPAIGRGLEKGGLMLAQTASEMATTMPGAAIKSGIAESERIDPISLAGAASAFPTFRPLAKFLPGYHAGGGLEPRNPAVKNTLDKTGDILLHAGETGREFYEDVRKGIEHGVPKSRRGKDFIDDPGLLLNPSYLAEASVESIVSMVPPLVAAFAGGGPAVAGAIGGGMEGLGALGEMVDDGMQPDEALVRSGAYGMASAALNAYSFDKILSKQVVDGLIKKGAKVLGAAGVEGFTEWLEGPIQALAQYTGTLPMVQDGSTALQSAARGLEIARTPDSPQDMIAALTKAAREEAAVIPGAFIAGGGAAMIAPSEGGFTFSEEDKGRQTRRKLENNEPVDLMDAAPKSDQGQPAVDPRIQAKRQALMNAFADLQRQAQAQAEMPTTQAQRVIEGQVGLSRPPARPEGYYAQPIIAPEQLQEFEQGLSTQPGPVETYQVEDLEAEWNARMAEQDAMNQQARLEAEWKARTGQQPFGGLEMPRQKSAASSPAVGNIPGQQARGLQRGTASPAVAETMVQAQTPVDQKAHEASAPQAQGIARRGRDEDYGIDVEMTGDATSGFSITETGEGHNRIRKVSSGTGGIYLDDLILNQDGEFVPARQIVQAGGASTDSSQRPFKPAPEKRGDLVALVAEIEFQRSTNNMEEVGRLEAKLEDMVFGKAHAAADLPGAGTVTAPSQGEASTISEPPAVEAKFDDMVKDAARWRGAARNLSRELQDDKRASVRLSKMTTKGDLDAYLMRKYGLDAADARNVSNHLTAQNVPDDMTATVEEFKDEPWAKEFANPQPRKPMVRSKKTKKPVGDISKADRPSAETVTAPPTSEASTKEPWQMTQEGFRQTDFLFQYPDEDVRARVGRESMMKRTAKEIHRGFVEDALSEGKPVPAEVLAEYPDLAPPTLPADQRTQEQTEGKPVLDPEYADLATYFQKKTDDEVRESIEKNKEHLASLDRDIANTPGPRGNRMRSRRPLYVARIAYAQAEMERRAGGHDVRSAEELAAQYQKDGRTRSEFIEEAPLKLGWIYRTSTGALQEASGTDARRKAFEDAGYSRPGSIAEVWDKAVGTKGDVEMHDLPRQGESKPAQERKALVQREKPKKPLVKKAVAERNAALADYFTPGNIVKGYAGHDRVVSFTPADNNGGGWNVTVMAVQQDENGNWVDVPGARQRVHATMPGDRELKAGPVKRERAIQEPQAAPEKKQMVKKADQSPVLDRATYVRQIASLMRNRRYRDADAAAKTVAERLGLPKSEVKVLLGEAMLIEQRSGDRMETFTQDEQNLATQLVPSLEWIKINRDKTVEADIPEAAKEKLTLKQQKAWLLAEIDKAMKSDAKGGKPFEFHVPGDGHFRVKAEQLAEFKKRVEERFPEKERPSALGKNPPRPTQSSRGRITEGEYYNEWQDNEVKIDAIFKPEDKDSPFPAWDAKTSVLHNGVALVVLPKKPMLKGVKENKADVESFLKHSAKEISERAEIVGQFKRAGLSEEDESRRLAGDKKTRDMLNEYADNMATVFAHVRYGDKDAFFHADKVDMLRTQYPDAEIRVSKNGTTLGMFVHGKVVGIAMGVEGVELSDYHKARIEEIAAAKEGRSPRVKAADTKVETKQPVAEEVEMPVAEGTSQQPNEQAKPVTGRTRWFVDYSETNKERTTETKSFATLAEAREFAKGKSGYISKQEDTGSGLSTDATTNAFKEYFGDFDPSAQEGQKMKAAFGEVPAVKRDEAKDTTIRRESRTFRDIDTLNALTKPIEHEDWIKFADGSEWQAKQGYTARGWTLVRDGKAHPTIQGIESQVELVAAVVQQQDALKTARPAEKIDDFGEKIGGAKKDLWSGFRDKMNEVSDDDIKAHPLSKIWPSPDYQALIDSGTDKQVVALLRAMRDAIPTKPQKGWKVDRWAELTKSLRDTAMALMDGKMTAEQARRVVNLLGVKNRAANSVKDVADLYLEVGHEKSLAGLRVDAGQYSLLNGVKYNPPKVIWAVEQDQKATAFSNFPRMLATGSTREEAIADFKKKYDRLNINAPAAKQADFDIYSKVGTGEFFVGKKIGRNYIDLAGPFDSAKEARAYKFDNQDSLVEKLAKAKEIPRERRDTNNPRVGEDMRGGQDATPEMFQNAFSFFGVQFGNYVEQGRRQEDLNEAYDALMDMAAILNIPPKALSLNGELGLAFGARGSGGKGAPSAHYEPGMIVINLTKKRGAGSLGHEWWHALDNYFSRMRGKKSDMMTEAMDVSLADRKADYEVRGAVRKEMIEAFGAVTRAIKQTALKARSRKLDDKRTKDYWTTKPEMSARAFESYLISKLHDQGASNDYLANIVDEATWKAAESLGFELDNSYPYPTAGEIPTIRAAFDEFFKTIESKETDKGVALYQLASQSTPSPLDIRAAFPWADSITEDGDGRIVITKGKNSFAVTKVEQITPDEVSFRIQYKRAFDPKTDKIAGDYREGEIRLSRVADKWTLMHEYEHALEDMGLINKMEQAIIDAAAKKAGYDMAPSENRAYYVQDQLASREFDRKTPAGRILQKIADFIDALVNLHHRTARGIVRDVESGKAMERKPGEKRKFILPMLQTAYHGSPHKFSKFSLDHMGSGEGAQAFGYGLYFAGKKEVAEFYREKLADNDIHSGQLVIDGEEMGWKAAIDRFFPDPVANKTWKKIGENKAARHSGSYQMFMRADLMPAIREEMGLSKEDYGRVDFPNNPGQLYKVEIPEDDVMLHWDKPLSEQPEKVREALYGNNDIGDYIKRITEVMERNGEYEFYPTGVTVYMGFAEHIGSQRSASEYLNSIGIKGIKYLDGSSRSQGEGSYNYVLFDDSAIEILETYYQVRPASQAAHYQLAGMNKVNRLIQAVAYRPETFGRLNFIHTQMDKALRSPQFKMVFNRISEMARTVSSSASSAASLAEDILPSPDKGFKATVKDIFDAGRFTDNDLRETSVALSAGSLAGDSPSPFDGKVFTDDELLKGVEVHGKTYRLTPEQVEAYRQTRAAVNKSVWDLATSEAWKRIRAFVDPDLWQVFADNSAMADVRMEALMYDALDQAERDAKAAQAAVLAQAGVRDLEQLAAHEKELTKFIRKMRKLARDMTKAEQSEDAMEKIEAIEEKMDRLESEYGMSMDDAIDDLKALRAVQKTHKEAVKKVANIEGTIHDVFEEDGVFDKARRLQAGGYMPLMRFGTYEIRVEDEDGKGVAMYRFDSSTEAKLAYDDLVAQYGGQQGVTITRPVKINTEAWKRFKDVNPDSILLFAKESDFGADQAMQEVYRKLYSDRSSMKRLIRRKGVPGYSDDLQRILSSFITSNARRVAANYHSAPVEQMITDIGNNDVQQEAQKVFEFFQSSGDPGSAFRSFAAHLRLLGSPMTAAINGTQVFTSTFPELVKHGATTTEALGRIFRAYRDRFKKDPASMTPDEEWAIARGVKDGTIDSAEIFHLYGMGTQTLVDKMPGGRRFKRSSSAALRARGMAFAWAEKLNRHVTLLAAFRMFSDQGMSREDAYQKAREVVDITQGRYGKENRPNLGRNPIAGAMLTFMQYKIMTLEQIVRNAKGDKQAKKAAALQILILFMLGGLGGAPFAEDAMDLLDIVMQSLFGRAWLSKNKAKKAVQGMSESAAGAFVSDEAAKMFGKFAGDFFEKGVSGLPGMPLDVSGRYRMGGTIPGLKLLKPSTQYRDSAVFDMFGVPGGMVDDAVRAIGLALDGEPWRGAQLWLPSDVQNFAKGLDIAATGKIRDTAGRLITEGNMLDASLQAIGAQPRKKSAITSPLWEKKEILSLTQKQERAFLKRYVEAITDGDEAAAQEVLDDLAAWNKNNPDWPIRITKMQVKKAMQDMAMTKEQRQLRMAPKEVRKNFVPGAP